jgi:P2-related tail formation protein
VLSPDCEAQLREALATDAALRRRLEALGMRVVIPTAWLNGAGSRPTFRRAVSRKDNLLIAHRTYPKGG